MENITILQLVSIILGVVGTFIGISTLLQKLYSSSISNKKDIERRLSLLEAKDKEVDKRLNQTTSPEKMAEITVQIDCLQKGFERLETQTNKQIEQLTQQLINLSSSFNENFHTLNEKLSTILIEHGKGKNN